MAHPTQASPPLAPGRRRGSASLVAVFAVTLVLGLAGAILMTTLSSADERLASRSHSRALFVADAGIADAVQRLNADDESDFGSAAAPVAFSAGGYWVDITPGGDDTYTVVSVGEVDGQRVALEAVVVPPESGLFDYALFAGNTSEDPLYTLKLGGYDEQADHVEGSIYSGGNILVGGDALVDGSMEAVGNIFGGDGESAAPVHPVPDLQAPDYAASADIMVKDLFDTAVADGTAARVSDDAGGTAWQLPEDNPGHIFRLNPSDRGTETASTEKDDYFLEDPYEPVRVDPGQDGTDPYAITLSGVGGAPGPSGTGKVYYIDGNLWMHNKRSYSFQFADGDADGIQVTFVVKGNVYFSDNLFYEDVEKDGVVFIAMEDPDVADSGNIYFGDPEFGTLRQMQSYMYAENTFYDVNLDEDGSTVVEVDGIMSAGDKVDIQRDYGTEHTKLMVLFDPRISEGTLTMPGLPPWSHRSASGYSVVSWRRVALP